MKRPSLLAAKRGPVDGRPRPATWLRDALGLVVIWKCAFGVAELFGWFQRSLLLLLFFAWLILAAATELRRLKPVVLKSSFLLLFLAVNIIVDLLATGGVTGLMSNYSLIWMLFLLGGFYRSSGILFRALALILLGIDAAIIMFVTTGELSRDPSVVRVASTAEGLSRSSLSSDVALVASFALVYALVVLAVFSFSLALSSHGPKRLMLLFVALGVSWWVLRASFAIALIVLLILFVIELLGRVVIIGFSTRLALILGSMALVLGLRDSVAGFLIDFGRSGILGDILSGKANDFAVGLVQGSDAMNNTRLDLYAQSLKVFVENFLIGVHSVPWSVGKVGGHSGWLDGLADFGILRYLPFVVFLLGLRRPYGGSTSRQERTSYDTAYMALLLVGFVNPVIFPQFWMVILAVIPLCFGTSSLATMQANASSQALGKSRQQLLQLDAEASAINDEAGEGVRNV